MPSLSLRLLLLFKLDLLEYPANKNRFFTEHSTMFKETRTLTHTVCTNIWINPMLVFIYLSNQKIGLKGKIPYHHIRLPLNCCECCVHLDWERAREREWVKTNRSTHDVRITCRCSYCGDTFSPNVIGLYLFWLCLFSLLFTTNLTFYLVLLHSSYGYGYIAMKPTTRLCWLQLIFVVASSCFSLPSINSSLVYLVFEFAYIIFPESTRKN